MAGTGSVAYLLKSMGKRVVANDYLHSNHATLNSPGLSFCRSMPETLELQPFSRLALLLNHFCSIGVWQAIEMRCQPNKTHEPLDQ